MGQELHPRTGWVKIIGLPPTEDGLWSLGTIKIGDEEYVIAAHPDHPPKLIQNGKVIEWP